MLLRQEWIFIIILLTFMRKIYWTLYLISFSDKNTVGILFYTLATLTKCHLYERSKCYITSSHLIKYIYFLFHLYFFFGSHCKNYSHSAHFNNINTNLFFIVINIRTFYIRYSNISHEYWNIMALIHKI